jgi:hypothetical protein
VAAEDGPEAANVRGSGKGLLCEVTMEIAFGRPPHLMVHASERDAAAEDRKRITSLVLRGASAVLFDNIRRPLGNSTLEAAITAPTWGERILGESVTALAKMRITWYATGNNLSLSGDMPRRCILIRLNSPHARPEERNDISERNLLQSVKDRRPTLVRACLVLLRAHFCRDANGVDDLEGDSTFPGWAKIIRGAVKLATGIDPWIRCGSNDDDADEDEPTHEKLVDGLAEALAEMKLPRAETDMLLAHMTENDEMRSLCRPPYTPPPINCKKLRSAIAELVPGLAPGRLPNAIQLGVYLRAAKNRPLPDGRFVAFQKSGGRWWSVGSRSVPENRRPSPAGDDDIERAAIVAEGAERVVCGSCLRTRGQTDGDRMACRTCHGCRNVSPAAPGACSC